MNLRADPSTPSSRGTRGIPSARPTPAGARVRWWPARWHAATLAPVFAAILALGGCAVGGDRAMRLHTLAPPAGAEREAVGAVAPADVVAFELQAPGVPAALDRPQLLLSDGDGGLTLREHDRWAAPLADELRAALALHLSASLGARDVTGLARPAALPVVRIRVELRRFELVPGAHALLDADWSVARSGDAAPRLLCHGRWRVATGSSQVDALVRAQRQAVAALARQIAATLRSGAADPAAGCAPAAS